MSTRPATLEAEAGKLSREDRVRLADHVIASVRGQDDIEQAWGIEVARRLAEVEAGTVALFLWSKRFSARSKHCCEVRACARG